MKLHIAIAYYILFFFSSSGSFSQSLLTTSTLDSIIETEKRNGEAKLAFQESAATSNYDINYLRAEWDLDPRLYFIAGKVTYYFTANNDITEMFFDLSDSMHSHRFLFHGITTFDPERPGDNSVKLKLNSTVLQGSIDSITIFFEGEPASTGFGSFTQSSHLDDSIIYTLSEPYGASDWFPCKNTLNDKIDSLDILITTPQQYKVGSNGILVEDKMIDDSTHLIHWKSHYPIATYLIGIAITNYVSIDEYAPLASGDTVHVLEYLYPEDADYYSSQPPQIISMLQLYSNLFGDYPFKKEKYGQAQWNWGGGQEHQTMSFVYFQNIYELISHELAHQWFGDKITCGSWQDIWLNEGFATYLAGLTYENLAPQYWLPYKSTQLSRALKDSVGSVLVDDTTNVSRIFSGSLTYSKGMFLLQMLRWKLGDELFFNAIRNYISDDGLCYNFARTSDLKQHLEDACGENLDEFFNDWFYGKGYPSYHITWGKMNDGKISITVHQTQNNAAVSFFEMPLPVQFKNGTDSVTVRLNNDFDNENYVVGPFDFEPDTLLFDPELWLASTHNTVVYDSALQIQVNFYPNPSHDELIINYYNKDLSKTTFTIYDMLGRKISFLHSTENNFFSPIKIDVSQLSAGCYIFVLSNSSEQIIRKFVKQ